MSIPSFDEIVEPNDQTEARREHLDALRELVGNVYPNKFARSDVSGTEDTITNILHFAPVVEIVDEIKAVVATLAERERPAAEIKDALNARLKEFGNVRIAGRLTVPPRVMGKAGFVHLSDGMNRLQIYVRRDDVQGVWNGGSTSSPPVLGGVDAALGGRGGADAEPASTPLRATALGSDTVNGWEIFKLLDHGDFIGVEGYLFITNTGELSVHVEKLQFLVKAMLPMPDKMHGIADAEIKQRQRYVDLIGSSLRVESQETGDERHELTTREVFERRAKIISSMRRFLEDHEYIEVETPMLTPKATGAAAKPFETYHNALDIPLYARVAPELYLKRLVVGGFEKVYELNRNFRNEGISYKHNPEFTMLEFYCAYMDVNGMIDFCEQLLQESVRKAMGGSLRVKYDLSLHTRFVFDKEFVEIDFSNFKRTTMKDAVLKEIRFLEVLIGENIDDWIGKKKNSRIAYEFLHWFDDEFFFQSTLLDNYEIVVEIPSSDEKNILVRNKWNEISATHSGPQLDPNEVTKDIVRIFDYFVESKLIQPTFIIDYPKSISPLSKASPEDSNIAERFELFINGMEVANGFSELNDPKEQYERFVDQMSERERGDEEAMILDEDYIRALSYGMPPAAGIGIGIDRLVMLLTNKHSIRDVILFPHMRPEKREGEKGSGGVEEMGGEETT